MNTMTRVHEGILVAPIPIQLMFGGCLVDPELVDVVGPEPRWDIETIDEVLEARCSSL